MRAKRLDPLIGHRRRNEERRQQVLADVHTRHRERSDSIAVLVADRDRAQDALHEISLVGADASEVLRFHHYLEELRLRIERETCALEALDDERREAHGGLVVAHRELRMVEVLKEQAVQREHAAAVRIERIETDEVVLRAHLRAQEGFSPPEA